VDGKEMQNEDDVANAIAEHKPGDRVEITYYRGDDKKTATVTLDKRPANADTSGSGSGGDGGGGIIP
jgi:S1-C subfamily serine protease